MDESRSHEGWKKLWGKFFVVSEKRREGHYTKKKGGNQDEKVTKMCDLQIKVI